MSDTHTTHIHIQPVKSSNISGLGYDDKTKTLEVHFASGGRYRYSGVPEHVFTKFLQADSKGAHFATEIRSRFTGSKVGEPPKP